MRFLLINSLFLASVFSAFGMAPQSSARAVHLRCDSLENPLGVDDARPQFAWQMQDDRRNARQTAYRIFVSSTAAAVSQEKGDVWDSGKVASDESLNIEYAGPQLESGKRYYWAVKIWDSGGMPSSLSEPAWWEMGLLGKSEWKAQWINRPDPEQAADRESGVKWIWLPGEDANQHVTPGERFFRYELNLDAVPKAAFFLVAGKDSMRAYVNGIQVGSGNTWGTFDVLDILGKLKPGANTIAVTVTSHGTGGMAALLKLTQANGAIQRIPTDARWQASGNADTNFAPAAMVADLGPKPIADPWPPEPANYFRTTFAAKKKLERARLYATSLGAYLVYINGQQVGRNILTPGWTDYSKRIQYQTYDVTQLVRKGTNAIGAVVGDGWYASGLGWKMQRFLFGPPPLRLLLQLELTFSGGTQQTVATGDTWKSSAGPILRQEIYAGETYDARQAAPFDTTGFRDTDWQPVQISASPDAALVAQRDQTIRVTETLAPKSVNSPAPGVFIFDLGQNISGWARLKVKGQRGAEVRLRFAEILKPDGNIYRDNLRAASVTDTFILSGKGEEIFEPHFTYHGFRYVEVTGYPGKPAEDAVAGISFHSAMRETGKFETSSELVNQLWRNIFWGQRDNLMSIPTDCPQRDERLGWMADAQIFWRTASYNMNMDAFTNKWMADVRDAQSPDGAFSDVSPRVVDTSDGAPAWGDAGIIVPWTTWQQYGDLRVVSENWGAMKKWLEYIQAVNPDFIWANRRNNDFGDWVPANSTTPKDLIATAFWAYDAKLMAQMAQALRKDSEAAEYRELYGKVKAAFIQKFVKDDGTVGNGSQTCDVLALYVGLLPENLRETVAGHLAQDIASRGGHLSTGFVGTSFLMPVLSANGKNAVAYQLLLNDTYPSWGYMIRKGATTMWERWNGDTGDPGMNSFNHYAFGSVGQWLYETVAGIASDPAHPGFHKIVIRPRPDSRLTHSYAEYESPYGKISTDWRMHPEGSFSLKVMIPPNTSAALYLPATDKSQVNENGRPLNASIPSEQEGDERILQVGSGEYNFEVK
ncbi:MAG: glycoside hydrolase family 78 protein [Acidobacteriota bacterium]|nr:glycoside hydrolase family 78 protein [Acidobacteriota bacterium]